MSRLVYFTMMCVLMLASSGAIPSSESVGQCLGSATFVYEQANQVHDDVVDNNVSDGVIYSRLITIESELKSKSENLHECSKSLPYGNPVELEIIKVETLIGTIYFKEMGEYSYIQDNKVDRILLEFVLEKLIQNSKKIHEYYEQN